MTIQNLFDEVDALVPNFYTTAQKLKWFNDLEYKLYEEVLKNYTEDIEDYADHTAASETPQIDNSYGREMYIKYIVAQIDFYNDEYSKYNQAITLFNSAYKSFSDRVSREKLHLSQKFWRI